MANEVTAKARVRLTVQVQVDGGWSKDCAVKQVFEQAADSARSKLINAFHPERVQGITIIETPEIIGIFTEEKR